MSTRPSSIETKGNEKTEICNQQVNLERGAIPYLPVNIDGYVGRLGVTPGNSWWSCVTRFSRSDQTLSFFTPVFSSDLQNPYPFSYLASKKLCHHYLDWNTSKKSFLKIYFEFVPFCRGFTSNSLSECRGTYSGF